MCGDLETCAKIFEVADLAKKLDLEVLSLLSTTLCLRPTTDYNDIVKIYFEYARHDLVKIFFKIALKLQEKAIADEKMTTEIMHSLICFFFTCARCKRGRKILRYTENFDVISQPHFLEPMFFNSKNPHLGVIALTFLVTISNTKSFTQAFIEKYVNRVREIFPIITDDVILIFVQSISQKILESKLGNTFLQLISKLPEEEKSKIIADDPQKNEIYTNRFSALVRCANCEEKEKSVHAFRKCSRCNSAHYCSKSCQKSNWPSHKSICK